MLERRPEIIEETAELVERAGGRAIPVALDHTDVEAVRTLIAYAGDNPARIFVQVPSWPGPFDVEIDCVAVVEE